MLENDCNSAIRHSSFLIRHSHRGQAMIELAFGMFALALVVSALCAFAIYIARSLEMQNSLRVGSSSQHDTMEVSDLAAQYIFGKETIKIEEKVTMPMTSILK